MVRAKFHCNAIAEVDGDSGGYQICMFPVYCGSEENEKFYELTPSGIINLSVVKKETAELFKEGKEYYVDFTECENFQNEIIEPTSGD